MNKAELLDWLQAEYREWEAFLDQINPALMEQPGVAGHWSIKDVIAHLTGWQSRLIANIQAAQRGEAEPPLPWPAHLQTDDEVNAWLYEANRARSLHEVIDESRQAFQQLRAGVEALPDTIEIEPEYHNVRVDGRSLWVGEFFHHFHDDHEADIRAWLARVEQQ